MLAATVQASREERERRQQERFRDRGGIFMKSEESITKPLLDQLLARADKRAAKAALTPARAKDLPTPETSNPLSSPTPDCAPPPKKLQKTSKAKASKSQAATSAEVLFKKNITKCPAETQELVVEDPLLQISPTKPRSSIRSDANSRAGPSSEMLDSHPHPSSPPPALGTARVSRSKGNAKTRLPIPEPEDDDLPDHSASPTIAKILPPKPRSIIRTERTGSSRRDRIKFTPDVLSLSVGGTRRRESLHSRPRVDSKQYADEVEERIKAEEAALKEKGTGIGQTKGKKVKVGKVETAGLEDDETLAQEEAEEEEDCDIGRVSRKSTQSPSAKLLTTDDEDTEESLAKRSSKASASRVTAKKKNRIASKLALDPNSDSEDDVPIIRWAKRPKKAASKTKVTSKPKPKVAKKNVQAVAEKLEKDTRTDAPARKRKTAKATLEVDTLADDAVPSPKKATKSRKRKILEPETDADEEEAPVLKTKRYRTINADDVAEDCKPTKPKSTPRTRTPKATPSAKMKENSVSPRRRTSRAKANAPKARPPLPIMSPVRTAGGGHHDEFDFL